MAREKAQKADDSGTGSSLSSSSKRKRSSANSGSGVSSAAPAKPFRPLSTLFGPPASSNTSSVAASSSTSQSPKASKRKVASAKSKEVSASSSKSKTAEAAIELSSDDDVIVDDSFDGIKALSDSDDEGKDDDDLVLTGFQPAVKTTSSTRKSGKTHQTSAVPATQTTNVVKQNGNETSKLSAKSKGKQREIVDDNRIVELDIHDSTANALWSEKYWPSDLDSLCVHKKKVQDVQAWLQEAWAGGSISKYRRIIILSGPAGCGKTATLRVLSKEMGFEITEYKTSEGSTETASRHLPAFLAKAASATSLSFGTLTADDRIAVRPEDRKSTNSSNNSTATIGLQGFARKAATTSTRVKPRRRLLLIEDFPNIFTSQTTRSAFQSALLGLAGSKRSAAAALEPNANVPLAIIVSESLARPGQNQGEVAANKYQGTGEVSISVRSVVPFDVMRTGNATEFKFNPIAATLMKKALTAIIDHEYARDVGKRPSADALTLVIRASDGDIRSALNTLQFVIGDGSGDSLQNAIEKKTRKRKAPGTSKSSLQGKSADKALMHLLATKESSLFLFHALGKVLFNKRWGEKPEEDAKSEEPKPPDLEKLPKHLYAWERRLSKVDANALFADAPVDSDMFMSYLHQNYPPFCDGIHNCVNMMDYLSISDSLMRMEGDIFTRHALTSHYSFQVSVRGALLALPSPVQRRGQKMFKSEVWDVQRRAKDNMAHIEDWIGRLSRSRMKDDQCADLLPGRLSILLETLPLAGLIQAPHGLDGAGTSMFKKPPDKRRDQDRHTEHGVPKFSKTLLEVAFFPQVKTTGTVTTLNDKDVVEDEDEEEKPNMPAVKIEDDDTASATERNDPADVEDKLYLSDDDIDNF